MAKTELIAERVSIKTALERLKVVMEAIEEMQADERTAAFRYIKDRYRNEWPSDSY